MNPEVSSKIQGNHIVFIGQKGIPAEFAGTSGIEYYVEKRAILLAKRGKTVICYVRQWASLNKLKFYKGIQLVIFPSINTKHLDAITHTFLCTIHACFSPVDTIWFQAIGPAIFSPIAKLFNKKVLVTIHGLDWKRKKWNIVSKKFIHFCERILVLYADEIFVVSNDLKEYYLSKYSRHTTIDTHVLKKRRTAAPNIIRKKYGVKGNDYILYMGRFVPEKRVDWIIKAYQKISPKNILLIVAGGSSHTDAYTADLSYLANDNPNIILPGFVFGREKEELLGNCKIFILPSLLEGNPVVIHELNQYNRPVLISDNIHVQNIKNQYQFQTLDFDDFVHKLRLLV